MLEIAVEQLSAIVYTIMAGALGVLGFLTESAGINTFTAGQNVLGAWEALIGLLLLIAAAKLVREKILVTVVDS